MEEQFQLLNEALQGAASQEPNILKAAELKLKSWETQPGFYSALIRFAQQHEFNTNARFMAIIYLKNGVERNWRRPPTIKALPDEEKQEIRNGLKSIILLEPVPSISTQLALTVGKIARFDVPKDWPDLLPMLMESVRLAEADVQYRALLTTHSVIKSLSTKRLTGDRKLFQEISLQIFDYLSSLWDSLFIQFSQNPGVLPRAHSALKILRILCIRGYKVPAESESVQRFISKVMARAKEASQLRSQNGLDQNGLLEKHITTMWKVVADLLETHPFSFVPFLEAGLEFAAYFGFSEEGRALAFERVLIHALNLMKGIVLCPEFMMPKEGLAGSKPPLQQLDPLTLQAAKVKRHFFQDGTLEVLIRVLVTRYLPLTQAELEAWSEDPEEFALRMEESGEGWKYNLRQSAEVLLVTLFKEFRTSVAVLLTILQEFQTPLQDPSDSATILAKDSLYNAAGMTAYELYDEFSFDAWLHSTLIQELSLPVPILHRRITWLVGQWTGVKINAESRPTVYQLLSLALKSPDVVVRLSAAQALRSVLDDFDFEPEQFVPCLEGVFFSLYELLVDVKESDSKMRVLHTIAFLIERMAPQIKSTIQLASLTQYLPCLWNSQHNMLKAAVISTSIQLVHALGSDSIALKDFLLPVIRLSTDLNSGEHVYLLEDGLELWCALMEWMAEPADPCFLTLMDQLIPLLTGSTEYLKACLTLLNSYSLIYGESFVRQFGSIIVQELNSAVGDMTGEGASLVLRTLENFLRAAPISGPEAVRPILTRIFRSAADNLDTPILMSLYLSIISRLLLISEPSFNYGLQQINSTSTPEQALAHLVEILCDKVSYIVQMERKKLICIGLLKLLSSGEEIILQRVCGVFLAVGETLNDIVKSDTGGGYVDSLYMPSSSTPPSPSSQDTPSTPNDLRKKVLSSSDVVYSLDLVQLFRSQVNQLRLKLGQDKFNEAMGSVDVETMAMARGFLE